MYSHSKCLPRALALVLLAGIAAQAGAQNAAPPLPAADSAPKLSIVQQLGIPGLGSGALEKHVALSGMFTLEKGSRRGTLSMTARIDPGWHIYSITQQRGGPLPSKIKVAEAAEYKVLGPFQANQQPAIKHEEVYKVPVEEHEGTVTWSAPLELSEGVAPESLTIELFYGGQVCSNVCIPLSNEKVKATFAGYTAAAETPGEYHPASSQAQLVLQGHIEPAAIAPGGKAKLVITAIPNPGWHVYAYAPQDPDVVGANKPTLIYLAPLTGWTRSPIMASGPAKPKTKPAQAGLPEEKYHDEPVTWMMELTAPANAPPGETVVSGYLGFQTCKEGCLPPHAVQFRALLPVKVAAQDGAIPLEFMAARGPAAADTNEISRSIPPEAAAPMAAVSSYRDVARLAAANPGPTSEINFAALVPIVGFGLLGGLVLNLMPCVLPVIGLKLLSFVQQGGHSRGKIFTLNLWFAAGLLIVFLALATLAAFGSMIPYLGQNLAWGQQFTFLEFKVAMVVIVFAFALSFLGVWEIPIPGFAQSSASSKLQQQEGAAGAFFKGIFTTLLATPCSGPFLGTVFAYTLAQPPLVTYIIFTSVGVGMALPYLIIGAFPALVRWLPKPGAWMETVKQLMGFVLLGTVVYLFATISADYFIPTLALVMGVWFACWLIGRVPIYEPVTKQLWAWISGCAAAIAIGCFAFTFLGPVKHLYEWKTYSPDAIANLQSEGKTIMVDFTADWCATCQTNFIFAINTPRVKEAVEKNGVLPMLADWSDRNEMIKAKLTELNSISIPLLAIYPANKPGEVIVLRDAVLESQVLSALQQAGPSKSTEAPRSKAAAETAMAPSG